LVLIRANPRSSAAKFLRSEEFASVSALRRSEH
jgi:hypothetical protein